MEKPACDDFFVYRKSILASWSFSCLHLCSRCWKSCLHRFFNVSFLQHKITWGCAKLSLMLSHYSKENFPKLLSIYVKMMTSSCLCWCSCVWFLVWAQQDPPPCCTTAPLFNNYRIYVTANKAHPILCVSIHSKRFIALNCFPSSTTVISAQWIGPLSYLLISFCCRTLRKTTNKQHTTVHLWTYRN